MTHPDPSYPSHLTHLTHLTHLLTRTRDRVLHIHTTLYRPYLITPSFLLICTYEHTNIRKKEEKKHHAHAHSHSHSPALRLLHTNLITIHPHPLVQASFYSTLLYSTYNNKLPCNLCAHLFPPSHLPFHLPPFFFLTILPNRSPSSLALSSTFHRRSSSNPHRSSPPTAIISKLPSNSPRLYFSATSLLLL